MTTTFKNIPLNSFSLLLFFLFVSACKTTTTAQSTTQESYLTFEKKMVDFGTVKLGESPSFTYKFTNTGKEVVTIELASGCDCTDIVYPEMKPFKPGESGEVKVTFISKREEERGALEKTIDLILLNKDPKTGYQIIKELKYKVNLVE